MLPIVGNMSADNLISPLILFDLLSEVINLAHRSEPVFRIAKLRVCPMRNVDLRMI